MTHKVQEWVDMPAGVDGPFSEGIGRAIAEARKQRGLTQGDLGAKTGNSKNAVSNWERGKSAPTVQNLRELCGVLKVRPEQLLGMNGSVSPSPSNKAASAGRQLVKQLAGLRANAEKTTPDLIQALKDAEQNARTLVDKDK